MPGKPESVVNVCVCACVFRTVVQKTQAQTQTFTTSSVSILLFTPHGTSYLEPNASIVENENMHTSHFLKHYFTHSPAEKRSSACIAFLASLDAIYEEFPEIALSIVQELADQRSHLKL